MVKSHIPVIIQFNTGNTVPNFNVHDSYTKLGAPLAANRGYEISIVNNAMVITEFPTPFSYNFPGEDEE